MKLATLKSKDAKNRDGDLVVVSRDLTKARRVESLGFPSLKAALQDWAKALPALTKVYDELNSGKGDLFQLRLEDCLAPLPTAPGFYDGSAFLSHVVRARKARGDQMPESAKITPLMYQGVSDCLISWNAPLDIMDPVFGADFEGEFAVITADVPRGADANTCESKIALFTMFNDVTYRELLKTEIETKFGFLQSKPNSSFAPIVVTADEFGPGWKSGRVALDLEVKFNGQDFGRPNGSEMHFSFPELVAHAARTRPLSAGSIIGSGTVSNEDKGRGFACLTEKRFQEILDTKKATTPWLKAGDRVTMNVWVNRQSLFGPIDQTAR